ncbi:MAG: DUF1027 domain-containing protein [Acholeplasmatales bacterium]|nr:DUF1027 domain-containing protein [Acholeplasmatales bacterium]
MLLKTKKGMFHLQKNYKEAFALEEFESKYIEECLDKYLYIVGDLSSNILRLKGFDNDPNSPSYIKNVDDYLEFSCAYGCPYYLLRRVTNEENYNKLPEHKKKVNTDARFSITPIVKENYDKESLVLKSTPKIKANVVIDMQKINAIPKGELTEDLKEYVKNDKTPVNTNSNNTIKQEPQDVTQSYVSASPDFDPSKSNSAKFNRNNNSNNKKQNNNHNKQSNSNNKKQNNNHNKHKKN